MSVTLYNVISKDGFIATIGGTEDFIPDTFWNYFLAICAQYDALIIGRKTYEAIQSYGSALVEPFETLPIKKIILTTDTSFTPNDGYIVVHSLKESLRFGEKLLLCSGPTLNDSFLKERTLTDMIVNIVPTTLGNGIKQFTNPPRLSVVSEKEFPDRKEVRYNVIY